MAVGRTFRVLAVPCALWVCWLRCRPSGPQRTARARCRPRGIIPRFNTPRGRRRIGIAALAKRLAAGETTLAFNRDNGYLTAILQALGIPVESQAVVFSETSVQADLITAKNPRALFFDDTVAVGWVRGADTLELAAHDPQQGVVFYTLDQRETAKPQLARQTSCLTCHLSQNTQNVPGMLTFTTQSIPQDKYSYASGFPTDHRTPIPERWGGWYVTGRTGGLHLGNTEVPQTLRPPTGAALRPRVLDSLKGVFDLRGFPTAHSDVVALMLLEHQATMINLLTRVGWEARIAEYKPAAGVSPATFDDAVRELVDYLLFVDEAPLPAGVARDVGVRGRLLGARAPRRQRPLAAGSRPAEPSVPLSLQLSHLLPGVRCASGHGEDRCLWAAMRASCRARSPASPIRASALPIAGRSWRF